MKPPPQRAVVIAGNVRQKRDFDQAKGRKVVFLLVEGDDDKKLYKRFVDEGRCRVQIAYGRPNVEGVLSILEKETFWGVLGIIDADFDGLEGREPDSPNLLRTDTHDAETMMLASPALDHLLREHGEDESIEAFENNAGRTVREHLLELASLFGALRWISARNKLRLRFEGLAYDRVIAAKTWTLESEKVLPELQEHSGVGVLDHDHIKRHIDIVFESSPDLWQLCCGHDMVALLAIGIRHEFCAQKKDKSKKGKKDKNKRGKKDKKHKKRNPAEVKPESLEKDLRLAYETAYFATTNLCRALRVWEQSCAPILIDALRESPSAT